MGLIRKEELGMMFNVHRNMKLRRKRLWYGVLNQNGHHNHYFHKRWNVMESVMMKPCQSYINKSTQKGGIQRTKRKDPRPKRHKNHLRRWITKETSSSQTPSFHKKKSNKERGGLPKRMLSLKKPLLTTITCLTYARHSPCYVGTFIRRNLQMYDWAYDWYSCRKG
jgi:hypothetical protein